MSTYAFSFNGAELEATPSGALWWPEENLLCVADLHLGKSERFARRGGGLLPPYETEETLDRLAVELSKFPVRTVICLGDSFDDAECAGALSQANADRMNALMAGRTWIWITGNHDPVPLELGGDYTFEHRRGPLLFRHAAEPGARGEVSGHYHPKARISGKGRSLSRPCFLLDRNRLILPAFGAYTGGLRSSSDVLCRLMARDAKAILTGPRAIAIPMPRAPQMAG